ncbi:MAG: cobyric acid synthase [Rhizobiaceae bacterium]|nr:cobyric acid synthase [Rhizobiaceae bacterium]
MVGAVSKSKALMLQGTGSNVGKSMLVAGLCRAAKKRGLKVLPFKPQNMSNNAAVALCEDGTSGEIGRAQWLQALACGVAPLVDMNPVLLKPQSETGSQVVVHGKVIGNAKAREYQAMRPQLLASVMESYERLKSQADIIIVEGAGSPAEINLRKGDIANMGFALKADVPVVLAGDIDRGGVIASLVGTHTILDAKDRAQIKGFIINKFRGDVSLFDEGREQITAFTRWRDFGVLPWLEVMGRLPEEDSVWFSGVKNDGSGSIKIAVPVCDRIANFDDFDPLAAEDDINLVFVKNGETIPGDADLIILAGSKSTIGDMAQMEANGWAQQIKQHAKDGGRVIGICGGYQMLGMHIGDPDKIEGNVSEIAGLGLLDIKTVLAPEKTVRISEALSVEFDVPVRGYEIHTGATTGRDCERAMLEIDGRPHGARCVEGKISGCYLHGLFGNDAYRRRLLNSLGGQSDGENHIENIDKALDELAMEIEQHIDVEGLLGLAGH